MSTALVAEIITWRLVTTTKIATATMMSSATSWLDRLLSSHRLQQFGSIKIRPTLVIVTAKIEVASGETNQRQGEQKPDPLHKAQQQAQLLERWQQLTQPVGKIRGQECHCTFLITNSPMCCVLTGILHQQLLQDKLKPVVAI